MVELNHSPPAICGDRRRYLASAVSATREFERRGHAKSVRVVHEGGCVKCSLLGHLEMFRSSCHEIDEKQMLLLLYWKHLFDLSL